MDILNYNKFEKFAREFVALWLQKSQVLFPDTWRQNLKNLIHLGLFEKLSNAFG